MSIQCLSPAQIQRVFDVTDALGLHRNWVVVPLAASETPNEMVMPDGKVLIRPPGGAEFDRWVADLRRRLLDLGLERTPRTGQHEIPKHTVPGNAPPGSGSRRLYLPWDRKNTDPA